MGFLNGASALKEYFVLTSNGSKYYLKYTFKAVHVLGVFELGTSLVSSVKQKENASGSDPLKTWYAILNYLGPGGVSNAEAPRYF